MESFYITLPSNVKSAGTPSHYVTPLPYALELPGRWEVALTEIHIPHAWHNVDGTNNQFAYYEGEKDNSMPAPDSATREMLEGGGGYVVDTDIQLETFDTRLLGPSMAARQLTRVKLPQGYYASVQDLVDTMHMTMSHVARHNIHFTVNLNKTVTVTTERNAYLWLKPALGEMLGFTTPRIKGKVRGKYSADEKRGMYSVLVYTDIILPQIVGNVQACVLRVVPVVGSAGELLVHQFSSRDYLPVSRSTIDSIEIDIRTDFGTPIVFNQGKVLCKLHFRQCTR
jgi:hypothetical protein